MKFNELMNNLIGTGAFFGMVTFCVATVACEPPPEPPTTKRENYIEITDPYRGSLSTVLYDGHKLVIWDGDEHNSGILHHPSCDCLKTEVKP